MSDEAPGLSEPHPRIARIAPGRFVLNLPLPERMLLRSLLPELKHLVETRDPTTRRLFPTAYHDNPELEQEYRSLMGSELANGRLVAVSTVLATIDEQELALPALERWMDVINSLRLVFGTRLEAGEDPPVLQPEDPDASAYAVYEYLGWLMDQAVRAMSEDLAES
ncbi:MAG TPA: DUF2017 family protein [Actinomycetota bacterium]|nr:DUF2017 family protein [Actinomycetota bacterium]